MPNTSQGIPYPASTATYAPHTDMQALATAVDGLIVALPGTWATYTPTFTTSSGSPSIGAGTLTGRWVKMGKTVHAHIYAVIGSGYNGGTGGWNFSLPTPASTSAVLRPGSAYFRDLSAAGSGHFVGVSVINGASDATKVAIYSAAASNQVTNSVPFTWASGDFLAIHITYEAA